MPTRLFVRGQVVRDTARRRVKVPEVPADLAGELSPRSQFTSIDRMLRAGVVVVDERGITYRIVRYLDPRDGWAGSSFYLSRWSCHAPEFYALVLGGYLDGGLEEGSTVRRYRVRDERAALAELAKIREKRRESRGARK
jgi:hypothetical protein